MLIMVVSESGNKIIEVHDNAYDKHVDDIALNLRAQDFDEVFAFNGTNPYDVVWESWIMSSKRWIVLNKHNIAVAVLGVRPVNMFSNAGIPWLLGTKGLEKMKKFFIKYSKPIIEQMKEGFDVLFNYVDTRYVKAVKWLKWCGFTVEDATPFGALNMPFHRFYMECN